MGPSVKDEPGRHSACGWDAASAPGFLDSPQKEMPASEPRAGASEPRASTLPGGKLEASNRGDDGGDGVVPQPGAEPKKTTPCIESPSRFPHFATNSAPPARADYDLPMAWVKNTDPEQAEGLLKKIYRDAQKRAGKVWQILQIQSQNPKQLRASMGLYQACMFQDSALPARLRETLAVVVSKSNHCVY